MWLQIEAGDPVMELKEWNKGKIIIILLTKVPNEIVQKQNINCSQVLQKLPRRFML